MGIFKPDITVGGAVMISLEDIGASGFIVAQERIKELQKMDINEFSFILYFSKKSGLNGSSLTSIKTILISNSRL